MVAKAAHCSRDVGCEERWMHALLTDWADGV